ncbi:MAG: hypothetical protein G01um101429_596 [Parcubacteria group bacterium Gr01-1014_29]|nr:MAG: hypothetical protein G01um101429_596 [Parcubacteria group bacterium Gr01-1014_29]
MDIIQTINDLQQKPEQVRRRILALSVATCMIIIVGAWVMVESRRIGEGAISAAAKPAALESSSSPFALLKATFGDATKLFQNTFGADTN